MKGISLQQSEINKNQKQEKLLIPQNIDYRNIPSLSNEAKDILTKVQPENIAQAAEYGITPAIISILLVHIKAHRLAHSLSVVKHLHRLKQFGMMHSMYTLMCHHNTS